MSITFSHNSALELYQSPYILKHLPHYRIISEQPNKQFQTPRRVALERCSSPALADIKPLLNKNIYSNEGSLLSPPIHTLVSKSNKRRSLANLVCHVKSDSPDVIPLLSENVPFLNITDSPQDPQQINEQIGA